jgi:hypothetical protein
MRRESLERLSRGMRGDTWTFGGMINKGKL